MAEALLQNGNRFGRQHVVFRSKHSYPSYVVRYRVSSDAAAASLPVIRAQCSAQCVSVSVAGKQAFKGKPQDLFTIVVVNLKELKTTKTAIFSTHQASGAKSMIKYITSLKQDDIVVVAGTSRSIPSKRSQIVVDVLRSLRSVGGSLHMLDCPYVLVGAKRPYVLNGLVHEDHQPGKAAVAVDMRVIRYNRDTTDPRIKKFRGTDADDMIPKYWQFQDSDNPMWKDFRGWCSRLTEAYKYGCVKTAIDDHTVDFVKMKMGRFKIRCLNWKGEILPSV